MNPAGAFGGVDGADRLQVARRERRECGRIGRGRGIAGQGDAEGAAERAQMAAQRGGGFEQPAHAGLGQQLLEVDARGGERGANTAGNTRDSHIQPVVGGWSGGMKTGGLGGDGLRLVVRLRGWR